MTPIGILLQIADRIAKMDLLLVVMEDLRLDGNTNLHLKYMEMYDAVKSEYKELDAQLPNTINNQK